MNTRGRRRGRRAGYGRNIHRGTAVLIGVIAAVLVTVCLSVSSIVLADSDKEEEPVYKYYRSIEIQPGDCLWSIASEYCYDMNMSVNEYVREIKELNHLSSDSITSGQYLTIMYVSTEYK